MAANNDTNDPLSIEELFKGWDRALAEYHDAPDYRHPWIAETAMSFGAHFDHHVHCDDLLSDIHADFGLLEALHGADARRVWALQAKRIKEAKEKYGIET